MASFAGLIARADFADNAPRIRDLELGAKLGYADPYDLRRLVRELHKAGRLPGAVPGDSPKNAESLGKGRPGREYWLDERGALLVASQSGMPAGVDVTMEVIDVFVRFRSGELFAPVAPRVTHLLLSENPCEWDPMFERVIVEGFCKIHGKDMPEKGAQPQWLASSYAKLYSMVLGKAEYAALKLKNGEPRFGSNHHQFLKPGPRDRFRRELKTVVGFLSASLATPLPRKHFWELMSFHYEGHKSIQMWMPV